MTDREMQSATRVNGVNGEEFRGGMGPGSASVAVHFCLYVLSAAPALATQPLAGKTVASLCLGIALILLSTIDIRSQRLPDVLTLPLLAAGILVAAASGDEWTWNLAAAFVAFLALYGVGFAYRYLRGRQGLGLGDAKLLAAAGAWVGFEGLPSVLLLASTTATLLVCIAKLFGFELTRDTRIPFGPFLSFAMWIVWLYGSSV